LSRGLLSLRLPLPLSLLRLLLSELRPESLLRFSLGAGALGAGALGAGALGGGALGGGLDGSGLSGFKSCALAHSTELQTNATKAKARNAILTMRAWDLMSPPSGL